jgi:hypothetical protein
LVDDPLQLVMPDGRRGRVVPVPGLEPLPQAAERPHAPAARRALAHLALGEVELLLELLP